MRYLFSWIEVVGGILLLIVFKAGLSILLIAITNPKLFFEVISQTLDFGVQGATFLLMLYVLPILGIVLIITGIWQLHHRYMKNKFDQ